MRDGRRGRNPRRATTGSGGDHSERARTKGAPVPLQITLNGFPGPETAGILLADRLGYFADAGLDLTILEPAAPSLSITYAVGGASDIVVSQEPELVLAQDEGQPVVTFGSLLPHPSMSIIWLPDSGIDGIADLKGKTIAYPGIPFQKYFLAAVLAQAGLESADVELKAVGYGLLPALERRRADAIFGGSWNVEGAALESRGLNPVVTKVTDLGVPGFDELVFVTSRGRLAKDPDLLRAFLKAAYRGARAVKEDPAAGSKALVEESLEPASLEEVRAGVRATAPLLSESAEVDHAQAVKLVDWMYEQGMIERRVPVSEQNGGGEN